MILISLFLFQNFFLQKNVVSQTSATPLTYHAVVIGSNNMVVDYAVGNYDIKAAGIFNGFSQKKADNTYFFPRVLKNAYGTDRKFTSAIGVVNTQNNSSSFTLTLYNEQGTKIADITRPISPFGKVSLYLKDFSNVPDGVYSGVIKTSGTKLVADINHLGEGEPQDNRRYGALEGKPQFYGASKWYIPIIHRKSWSPADWETTILVQNVTSSPVNFSIKVYRGDNGASVKTCSFTDLKPFAAKTLYIPSDSCLASISQGTQYTAIVEATGNVMVDVDHTSYNNKQSLHEEAFPSHLVSNILYTPRVYKNHNSWVSSITVQNTCSSNINVRVDYYRDNGNLVSTLKSDCSSFTLSPNAQKIIYAPDCLSDTFITTSIIVSAKVYVTSPTTNNNCLAGFYHIARKGNDVYTDKLAGGAKLHAPVDSDTVFFVPRVYRDYYAWNSSIDIMNVSSQQISPIVYILNPQGQIITRRQFTIASFANFDVYMPTYFTNLPLNNLTPTLAPSGYPPIPTPTPTRTPTPTPSCPKKPQGDADCNGSINETDYTIWKCEFLGNGTCSSPQSTRKADFNLDNKVNLVDFEIWRRSVYR